MVLFLLLKHILHRRAVEHGHTCCVAAAQQKTTAFVRVRRLQRFFYANVQLVR